MKSVHSERYARFLAEITDARVKSGLSQRQLAERLDKPQSYVSKYERGERRLDVVEFLELCGVLNLDACAVLRRIGGGEA